MIDRQNKVNKTTIQYCRRATTGRNWPANAMTSSDDKQTRTNLGNRIDGVGTIQRRTGADLGTPVSATGSTSTGVKTLRLVCLIHSPSLYTHARTHTHTHNIYIYIYPSFGHPPASGHRAPIAPRVCPVNINHIMCLPSVQR